ncbi:MAG: alpha/beta hydrolase [Candidatus Planktophila sp.]|nr:alpha/beta hydrolase [Candidatus Planktophila sp.]
MQELLFTRSNGQTVAYFDYGQSQNVVFFHHGSPSAGPISPHIRRNADANGFRIIEVVRPGYGSSTAIANRSVNTASQINLDIADALGIENFAIFGQSGGGPHALASGHLAGNRCKAMLIVAGIAPFDDPNFDFAAGMAEGGREFWNLPLTSMEDFELSVSKMATEWSSYNFNQFKEVLNVDPEDPISDESILSFQVRGQYSFIQGAHGLRDDRLAFLKPWGFSLEEISLPVQLWAGTKDVNVPPAHADYLKRKIPNSELLIVENKNHSTISEPAVESGFKWLRGLFDSHS